MDELIIIGGSAAGTAAAIYAARRNLKVRLISENLGGEVATSGEIENWPGTIHTTGIELADQFESHLKAVGIPIETGVTVGAIEKTNSFFTVTASKASQPVSYQTKTVLVTTGVHPRVLGIPGEKEFKNKGVSYCTVCDGPLYKGKEVATVGGGNSALESAIMLAGIAKHVTVLTINPELKGEAVLKEKVKQLTNVTVVSNATTKAIIGNQVVNGVAYTQPDVASPMNLAVQGVFIHIGMIPNSGCVHGVEKNSFGEIITNKLGETNLQGLFAAGDVTDIPFKQIIIAAGLGVTAVLQAVRYLDNLTE